MQRSTSQILRLLLGALALGSGVLVIFQIASGCSVSIVALVVAFVAGGAYAVWNVLDKVLRVVDPDRL